jgi:hypothetical protein
MLRLATLSHHNILHCLHETFDLTLRAEYLRLGIYLLDDFIVNVVEVSNLLLSQSLLFCSGYPGHFPWVCDL